VIVTFTYSNDLSFCCCGVMLPNEYDSPFCVSCEAIEDAKQINKLLKAQNEMHNIGFGVNTVKLREL